MKLRQLTKIPKLGGFITEQIYNFLLRPKIYPFKCGGCTVKSLEDKGVIWKASEEKRAAADHIELSGERVSAIVSYGRKSNGSLRTAFHVVFPSLRILNNMTTSALSVNYSKGNGVLIGGIPLRNEKLKTVKLGAFVETRSVFLDEIEIKRTIYPSTTFPALIEKVEIINKANGKINLFIRAKKGKKVVPSVFSRGIGYVARCGLAGENGDFRSENKKNDFDKVVIANGRCVYYNVFYAAKKGEEINFNAEVERTKREKQFNEIVKSAVLTTPSENIDTAFALSLFRGEESIFNTKAGLLHSPGGGRYYAAIWANDQMEYALPAFPFYSYEKGLIAAKNSIKLYDKFFEKDKPLPASIISEGEYPFGVAGDRGDGAMISSGLARFLLANGDKEQARERLPFLNGCIDYCLKKKTADGVISSDSDELEGRFPAGNCNLSTNCLFYDALKFTAIVERELGNKERAEFLTAEAEALKENVIKYFSAKVEGFDTYRYFENCKVLRSWSCLPLCVGIKGREDGVLKGIFEGLYDNGKLKTASDKKTVWDRSLLYALKGGFLAKKPDITVGKLEEYAKIRLLGEHSPYPYEAYPEGNGAQLAAESLLFTRVITEGLFGIEPSGFKSFKITPSLPSSWQEMRLSGIRYAQTTFDITVKAKEIVVKQGSRIIKLSGEGGEVTL